MPDKHEYDRELGRITERDCEYAIRLVDEIEEHLTDRIEQNRIAAEWLRKVRYEAVIADRGKHNRAKSHRRRMATQGPL